LDIGSGIGAKVANPSGAQLLYSGNSPSRETYEANAFNPFADAFNMASRNPALQNVTRSGLQAAFSQTGLGGSGFGTGLAYGNQDYGAFI
jgi:hypothetical protein